MPSFGRHWRLALGALVALGAANFLWQLGSSSLYVDEAISINIAQGPFGDLVHLVNRLELTPPAYFFFLHEWLFRVGSDAEWVARVPSVVCGVALVAVVFWLAWLMCERRTVALGAAALAALSPFVLEYAQRAQGYVFAMLAAAVAVAAAIQAERASRGRGWWLTGGAVAAVASLWLHYTALLVVAPACVWVATRPRFTVRDRAGYIGACVVATLALVPIIHAQRQAIPDRTGVGAAAGVTWTTVQQLLETPFDGRVDALRPLGIVVTVGAILILLAIGRRSVRERWLLLAVAAGEPLVLFVLSVFGAHLMLTRYAAVAAPFMLIAIAAAVAALVEVRSGRVLAAGLAGAALVASLAGLRDSHRRQGFYLDARGAVAYVRARERPNDAVLTPTGPGSSVPLLYYGVEELRSYPIGTAAATQLVGSHRHRLWVISVLPLPLPSAPALLAAERAVARTFGYRVLSVHVLPASAPLAVVLLAPDQR